jgi:hypothetical protein
MRNHQYRNRENESLHDGALRLGACVSATTRHTALLPNDRDKPAEMAPATLISV